MIQSNVKNLNNHIKFNRIKDICRRYLTSINYTEVDIPVLSPVLIPESYLEIFKTDFIYGNKHYEYYLTPSPEIFLKRLLANGSGSVFSLEKSFRNGEPHTSRHSPEFTMLEMYKVNADYFEVADDTLKLFQSIAKEFNKKEELVYQGKIINLNKWEYITVSEAFEVYANMKNILDYDSFFSQSEKKGYITKGFSYADVWSQIYVQEVEPHLGKNDKPTLIYEYPIELAALAEIDEEKKVAKRFECYIEGIELGNCAQETSGASVETERKRFQNDMKERKKRKMITHKPDTNFLEVVASLPKCSGIAIGIDRLAMLFTNSNSIEELKVININDN